MTQKLLTTKQLCTLLWNMENPLQWRLGTVHPIILNIFYRQILLGNGANCHIKGGGGNLEIRRLILT